MKTSIKNTTVTGVLFIIGTVAAILSGVFTRSILGAQDYLIKINDNENQIIIGALFLFVAEIACAGIAISMYSVLRKYNEGLALGSVGFRIIEGILGIVGVIMLILLLPLSQEFVNAGAPDSSYFQTIGALLLTTRNWVRDVPMLLSWNIGALMYYYIFYQTKLIPRWLSSWGIIGVTLCIVSSFLVMFHAIDSFGSIQVAMNAPIGLQEMVLAVWLIIKGFNPTAIASLPYYQLIIPASKESTQTV